MKIILTVLSFLLAIPARASIGQNEGSVTSDVQFLKANRSVTQQKGFTVHEIATSTHRIKEYVSDDKIVFAISWRGRMRLPGEKLQILLDSQYSEFIQKRAPPPPGRAPRKTETSQIIVYETGHMRDVRGFAVSKNYFPSNLDQKQFEGEAGE